MKRYFGIITLTLSLIIISLFSFASFVGAQSFKTGDNINVAENETIDSALFAGGNNINIAGKINGDLYCAGQNITISGSVEGDILCAGQSITVNGKVSGDVRLAGQSITINNIVGGNASIAGQTVTINRNGVITKDLVGGSQTITVAGNILRDITAGSNNLIVDGTVGRNIKGEIDSITVGASGKVAGDINYTGSNNPTVNNGGEVQGAIQRHKPRETRKNTNSDNLGSFVFGFFVYTLLSMLAIGLLLILLMPSAFEEAALNTLKRPGQTLLVGAAATLLTPLLILSLFATVVGIPLAFLVILVWIVVMMLITPFAGYSLGRWLLKGNRPPLITGLIGITILVILYCIPVVNFFIVILAYLFGVGMILMQGRMLFRPNTGSKVIATKTTTSKKEVK